MATLTKQKKRKRKSQQKKPQHAVVNYSHNCSDRPIQACVSVCVTYRNLPTNQPTSHAFKLGFPSTSLIAEAAVAVVTSLRTGSGGDALVVVFIVVSVVLLQLQYNC